MAYTKTTWVDEVPDSTPVKFSINGDVEGEISASAEIDLVTGVTPPGTPVNAANLNKIETGIEDAHITADAAIPKSTLVAAGDIIYGSGAGVPVRLPKSVARKSLIQNDAGSAPMYAGTDVGLVWATGSQNIATATWVTVSAWDASTHDTASFFSGGAPTKLTLPYTGFYMIGLSIAFDTNTTGRREIRISHQGSPLSYSYVSAAPVSGAYTWVQASIPLLATAGDYIEAQVRHTKGSNLNINGNDNGFWAMFLRASA